MDFGDAPDPPYPTQLGSFGASHPLSAPRLGIDVDAEPDGQPNLTATGDDVNGLDDEDGVTFSALVPGQIASVMVDVLIVGAGLPEADVSGWIDFNADGFWAPSEQVVHEPLPAGSHLIFFLVPPDAVVGFTFARFRVAENEPNLSFDGPALSGEVEDYRVEIVAAPLIANDDTATTLENTPVTIDVVANDTGDIDLSTIALAGATSNGTPVYNGDGTFTYTPSPGFVGVDTFVYSLSAFVQATVTVTVLALPADVCNSPVTTIDGLKAEVAMLTTSQATKDALNSHLTNAEAALSGGDNGVARKQMSKFISHVVKRSNFEETNPDRILLNEANSLICGGANVLIGIELP